MLARLNRLRESMRKLNIDALLINNPSNILYISGFTGSSGVVLITQESNYLVTDFRYIEQAKKQCHGFETLDRGYSIETTVDWIIKKDNVEQLWLEWDYISYSLYKTYRSVFEGIKLVGLNNIIEDMRVVKDAQELELIKKAATITDKTFDYILNHMKPGITEREVALKIGYHMLESGADDVAFKTIVATGANSSFPHGIPTDKKLEYGDLVIVDFGCVIGGYCSDMTRTVIIGKADQRQRELYNLVLIAQQKALEFISNNKKARDVDMVGRSIIDKEGFKKYFGHSLGHGVGLEVHERPNLSPSSNDMLVSDMVVTVEPGIYIPDYGGIRIEDLIVIKDDGYLNFTSSTKDLIVI